MKKIKLTFLISALIVGLSLTTIAQEEEQEKEKKVYEFTELVTVPHTPVDNQQRSGTCWSFAGTAFFEAEILRLTGVEYNLSEMFFVRNAYSEKIQKYIRMHGKSTLSCGGGFPEIPYLIEKYGLIPESDYGGKVIGEEMHLHSEMDNVIRGYADAILKNGNKRLTPVWYNGFESLLDTYLGVVPEEFTVDGAVYTPKSFAEHTKINVSDYIQLTSYTHSEFYKPFILEIPDNWRWSSFYNLKLDEMFEVIDYALDNGYTVYWDADVSDKGFSWKNGVAIVPEDKIENMNESDKEKWSNLSETEYKKQIYEFKEMMPEKQITPEIRQKMYDNYETTDDHLMLIVGKAQDQNGNIYYKVKNSWGTNEHVYDGYLYASKPYLASRTISICLHKDGVPKKIMKNLDL